LATGDWWLLPDGERLRIAFDVVATLRFLRSCRNSAMKGREKRHVISLKVVVIVSVNTQTVSGRVGRLLIVDNGNFGSFVFFFCLP
jgi:hypothetical protein